MDIQNITGTAPATAGTAASSQTATTISSDFETFLQMLTAQARYQDPLEPIDSSEYAAQLAQFSMVEQQVLSNDLLGSLGAQMGDSSFGQLAGWIGMDARTSAPVPFDGTSLTILPQTDATADEAVLVVYDSNGNEVQREQIPTGSEPFDWRGLSTTGGTLPEGLYSFAVESMAVGQSLGTQPAETYAQITEARRQGNTSVFVLSGGSVITATDVSALRPARSNDVI